MKREIKFRAWSRNEKKMYNVRTLQLWNGTVWLGEDADNQFIQTYLEPETVELMQYTGLKDKNGKEIYEGDIVKDNLGTVVIQGLCNAEKVISEPTTTSNDWLWSEVIGNIYENPELLI